MRRPTKEDSFQKIIDLGIPISTVIDVGVLNDTAELRTIFCNKKQLLIEPIIEWNPTIRRKYEESKVDFELLNVAASDHDGVMSMEVSSVTAGVAITHARLADASSGANVRTVPVRKLDTIVVEKALTAPFLLKLDVDGVEIRILEGARTMLPQCNVVVIEANIRNFLERASWLVAAGFELFDIVDISYYDGRLRQVDLVFLNSAMVQARGIDMYKQTFDMSKWITFK